MTARVQEIADSYFLLIELLTTEPFLQECLQLIENTCLTGELEFKIDGKDPSPEFKTFVNTHYYPFLKNAIRQAHGLGFVVWCVRKLPSGDKVPEVLPLGTFSWTVEPDPTGEKSLRYKIQLSTIKEVKFFVTEWSQPSLNERSLFSATVSTPLSHLLEEYRILRETIKRYHSADAWNTTARIVVSSEPKTFNHEASQKEVFETLDFLKGAVEHKRKNTLSAVEEAFASHHSATGHREIVYELPPHHHIENTPVLKPVVDIEFMFTKFRRSVCSLLGVPAEMVVADRTQNESRGRKATSRIFQNKMTRMCMFLSGLLQDVHKKIYRNEESEFKLVALSRLEVQDIEDLKTLHEIGVLQPDHALRLSEILLCSDGRPLKKIKKSAQEI
jgi:hypothetical protein